MSIKYTDAELLEIIKTSACNLGRSPRIKDIKQSYTIINRFGSWNNALKKAGLSINNKPSKILNVGDKIGLLTIIDIKKIKNRKYFTCKCDCGNTTMVRSDSLTKSNPTNSCGCLAKETEFKRIDLTNKRIGRLTVIKKIADSNNCREELWLCRCSCGNEITLMKQQLYGCVSPVKSCGCGLNESRIANALKANNYLNKVDRVDGTAISKITRKKLLKNNSSGTNGVYFDSTRNKWVPTLEFKGKTYYLGRYKTKEEAIKIRTDAENKYFKPFLDSLDNKHMK